MKNRIRKCSWLWIHFFQNIDDTTIRESVVTQKIESMLQKRSPYDRFHRSCSESRRESHEDYLGSTANETGTQTIRQISPINQADEVFLDGDKMSDEKLTFSKTVVSNAKKQFVLDNFLHPVWRVSPNHHIITHMLSFKQILTWCWQILWHIGQQKSLSFHGIRVVRVKLPKKCLFERCFCNDVTHQVSYIHLFKVQLKMFAASASEELTRHKCKKRCNGVESSDNRDMIGCWFFSWSEFHYLLEHDVWSLSNTHTLRLTIYDPIGLFLKIASVSNWFQWIIHGVGKHFRGKPCLLMCCN